MELFMVEREMRGAGGREGPAEARDEPERLEKLPIRMLSIQARSAE